MFEEAGVGAEEVVSSNDYDLCFVDTGEVSCELLINIFCNDIFNCLKYF